MPRPPRANFVVDTCAKIQSVLEYGRVTFFKIRAEIWAQLALPSASLARWMADPVEDDKGVDVEQLSATLNNSFSVSSLTRSPDTSKRTPKNKGPSHSGGRSQLEGSYSKHKSVLLHTHTRRRVLRSASAAPRSGAISLSHSGSRHMMRLGVERHRLAHTPRAQHPIAPADRPSHSGDGWSPEPHRVLEDVEQRRGVSGVGERRLGVGVGAMGGGVRGGGARRPQSPCTRTHRRLGGDTPPLTPPDAIESAHPPPAP
ncbi:hypothetical protein B0H14DRAFT_3140528 [Mycena olivaceomarginata]|nr:hypothetical protein B0H14DRAFT_3140528 [Mycena olivaceomarginata]